MQILNFEYGEFPYRLEAIVVMCGEDVSLSVCGGEKYHIGAVALAHRERGEGVGSGGASTEGTLIVAGHREQELAMEAAVLLASEFSCTATVSVGIHIDNASKEDISLLVSNFNALLELVVRGLQTRPNL